MNLFLVSSCLVILVALSGRAEAQDMLRPAIPGPGAGFVVSLNTQERRLVDSLNRFTQQQFMTLLDIGRRIRSASGAVRNEVLENEVQAFRDQMWLRSLLRGTMGIPGVMGSFGILSENFDLFDQKNNVVFAAEFFRRENDLTRLQTRVLSKIMQLELRSGTVRNFRNEFLASTAYVTSQIMRLMSILSGDLSAIEMNLIVLREIALDIEEELLISRGEFEEMRQLHRRRWHEGRSDEELDELRDRAARLIVVGTPHRPGTQSPRAQTRVLNTETTVGAFNMAQMALNSMVSRMERAGQTDFGRQVETNLQTLVPNGIVRNETGGGY